MRLFIALTLLALMAGEAFGLSILMPPKKYRHPPRVEVRVYEVDLRMLQVMCAMPREPRIVGCAVPARGLVLILKGLGKRARKAVLIHELAHINGWRHS